MAKGYILKLKYNKKIEGRYRHFDVFLDDKLLTKDADIQPICTDDGRLLKIDILRDGTIQIAWFSDHFVTEFSKHNLTNNITMRTVLGQIKECK